MTFYRIKTKNEKFNIHADIITVDDIGAIYVMRDHRPVACFKVWNYFYEIEESFEERKEEQEACDTST